MASKKTRVETTLTVAEAAEELGISASALYVRIRRARAKGEPVPFAPSRTGSRALVAKRSELLKWYEASPRKRRKPPSMPTRPAPSVPAPEVVSATSGEGDASPLAPSAQADTATRLEALEPVVTHGTQELVELPLSYMETRVTVMPRDEDTIVVYWDVHPEVANRHLTARWGIRVESDAGVEVIEVGHGARNWYIRKPGIALRHRVAFGPLDEHGNVIALAHGTWKPLTRAEARRNPYDNGAAPDEAPEWARGVVTPNGVQLQAADAQDAMRADTEVLVAASPVQSEPGSSALLSVPSSPHGLRWQGAS